MLLKKLDLDFTVCKVADISGIDFGRDFVFLSKTDEEISLVCESQLTPDNATEIEHGWKCLRIEGVLDFELIGVVAKLTGVLAAEGISVFVVSTYNTDYLFLKAVNFERSIALLKENGYRL